MKVEIYTSACIYIFINIIFTHNHCLINLNRLKLGINLQNVPTRNRAIRWELSDLEVGPQCGEEAQQVSESHTNFRIRCPARAFFSLKIIWLFAK